MINTEIKEKYINLIEKINENKIFEKEIKDFINTYDGTNELAFRKFILIFISILSSYNYLKINSDSYDELKKLDAELESSLDYYKDLHESVSSGNIPSNISVSNKR